MYKKKDAINSALLILQELSHLEFISSSVYSSCISIKDGYLILKFTSKVKIVDES